jgi:hypothetical protein
MAKERALEKSARKAYSSARDAVDEAKKAARKLDKKTRKKAAALEDRLAKVERSLAKSAARSAGTRERAAAEQQSGNTRPALTPPMPVAPVPGINEKSQGPDARFDGVNLQALRALAKERGLTNYSRLTKADLIHRLRDE